MRLFVALAVAEEVAEEIAALQGLIGVGRAVEEENLHLTLAFLDDVEERDLADLDATLGGITAPVQGVAPVGIDLWEGALVAVVPPDPGLEALARKVMVAARGVVDLPRRRFRPHVTMMRFGRRMTAFEAEKTGRFLSARADTRFTPFVAEAFTLYRSHLRSDGALYEPLAEYPLG